MTGWLDIKYCPAGRSSPCSKYTLGMNLEERDSFNHLPSIRQRTIYTLRGHSCLGAAGVSRSICASARMAGCPLPAGLSTVVAMMVLQPWPPDGDDETRRGRDHRIAMP